MPKRQRPRSKTKTSSRCRWISAAKRKTMISKLSVSTTSRTTALRKLKRCLSRCVRPEPTKSHGSILLYKSNWPTKTKLLSTRPKRRELTIGQDSTRLSKCRLLRTIWDARRTIWISKLPFTRYITFVQVKFEEGVVGASCVQTGARGDWQTF